MSGPRLFLLDGDGIGPEIVAATRRVLKAADAAFDLNLGYETAKIGLRALDATGSTIPEPVIEAVRGADGVVIGPVSQNVYPPVSEGGRNPSGTLRVALDLIANIRPARTRDAIPAPCGRNFYILIVRENTEGFCADRNMTTGPGEFMPDPDMALALCKITRRTCRRIAEAEFDFAAARPVRRVTAVHKANVLRLSDGLFLEECRQVAATASDVAYDEVVVDAMTAILVRDPVRFDVVVTTNMYGDILSDLAAELSGSFGLAASDAPRERLRRPSRQSWPAPCEHRTSAAAVRPRHTLLRSRSACAADQCADSTVSRAAERAPLPRRPPSPRPSGCRGRPRPSSPAPVQ